MVATFIAKFIVSAILSLSEIKSEHTDGVVLSLP